PHYTPRQPQSSTTRPRFLFPRSRHPRDLPSFPTRRSSDLEGGRAPFREAGALTRRPSAVDLSRAAGEAQSRERAPGPRAGITARSEEHTSELQSRSDLVCRLLLEKKKRWG